MAVGGEVEDFAVEIVSLQLLLARDDSYLTTEDSVLATTTANSVLRNDTDDAGLVVGAVLMTGPVHAQSFTLYSNGTFRYEPVDDYYGLDTFTYRAKDPRLTSGNVGTVTLTVQRKTTGRRPMSPA